MYFKEHLVQFGVGSTADMRLNEKFEQGEAIVLYKYLFHF